MINKWVHFQWNTFLSIVDSLKKHYKFNVKRESWLFLMLDKIWLVPNIMLVKAIWNGRNSYYCLIQPMDCYYLCIIKKNTVHVLSVQLIDTCSLIFHSIINFIISGNDAIHQLSTGRNSSLRITITSMNGGFVSFKMYYQFYVFGEDQNYRLQLANPGDGNLGTSKI